MAWLRFWYLSRISESLLLAHHSHPGVSSCLHFEPSLPLQAYFGKSIHLLRLAWAFVAQCNEYQNIMCWLKMLQVEISTCKVLQTDTQAIISFKQCAVVPNIESVQICVPKQLKDIKVSLFISEIEMGWPSSHKNVIQWSMLGMNWGGFWMTKHLSFLLDSHSC